jgi:hypothetical protein
MARTSLALLIATASVALLAAAALTARDRFGYRLAPLLLPHPQIEYLLKPNQDVARFGQRIQVNRWGMRSPDFPASRTDPGELRVLVFGDSIVTAVGFTSQQNLATTLLQHRLASPGRNAVVANVAAGSWGPGNWLAYAREYGFFDADVLVLVASGHDYADNRQFPPMHPDPRPMPEVFVPAVEFVAKGRVWLTQIAGRQAVPQPVGAAGVAEAAVAEAAVAEAMSDLERMLVFAQRSVPKILVVLHPEKPEIAGPVHPGRTEIEALCQRLGIAVIRPDEDYAAAMNRGVELYHDSIHPTDAGQELLALVIERGLRRLMQPDPAVAGEMQASASESRRARGDPAVRATASAWPAARPLR